MEWCGAGQKRVDDGSHAPLRPFPRIANFGVCFLAKASRFRVDRTPLWVDTLPDAALRSGHKPVSPLSVSAFVSVRPVADGQCRRPSAGRVVL